MATPLFTVTSDRLTRCGTLKGEPLVLLFDGAFVALVKAVSRTADALVAAGAHDDSVVVEFPTCLDNTAQRYIASPLEDTTFGADEYDVRAYPNDQLSIGKPDELEGTELVEDGWAVYFTVRELEAAMAKGPTHSRA